MGQYHYIVNLDKREFINPCGLGTGLKAWEQFANFPASPQALFALLICSNGRGGGDLNAPRGVNEPVIGRWAGDRIAVVGDYAEDGDIAAPTHDPVSAIYDLCNDGAYRDITPLVIPMIEAELGLECFAETYTMRGRDGTEHSYQLHRFRRDPKASFSVFDK